jgi:hypothetical protein
MLLAALVLVEPLLTPAPAFAQEGIQRFWLLRKLFSPRKVERPQSQAQPTKRKRTPRPTEPPIEIVEKAPDASTVLVVGDFLAGGLAEGLSVVFAQNPGVRILDRSKSSSGLVRTDVLDWAGQIKEIVETEKPAALVVMIGSNDRQQMRVGDTREPPLSAAWLQEYDRRAGELGRAIAATKVPMLWVGMPPFKFANMSSDMLALNDHYRAAAEEHGGEFIDIWDGFVDENGAYVAAGPDINGQPVRLRAGDGVNMTRAGKRKVAFYLEKPLNRILGLVPGGVAPLVPALPDTVAPADPRSIDRTPPISLNDPELDGGVELLGASGVAESAPGSVTMRLFEAQAPSIPGRADDFAWPPQPAAAAIQQPAAETTTAIPQ